MPPANAPANTLITGMMIRKPTANSVRPTSRRRTHAGSCLAGFMATRSFLSAGTTPAPAFEEVDRDQHRERDHEQHDSDRGGFAVCELVESRHDQKRRDLRLVRQVAGDEND